MNLADYFLQSFRLLLLPFSILYGLGVWIRNRLYDKQLLSSTAFNLPVICVGNLSVGGTGKSPMIEYLTRMLQHQYRLAILSRGYKRKTRGYVRAMKGTTALEIGDEPMQFFRKFPEVEVAVGEERVEAIPMLMQDAPQTELILLDDGFQHRAIRPGLSILLTDSSNLFTRDFFLPTGDLRDERSSMRRADLIVVTKCDPDLSAQQRQLIIDEIAPSEKQEIYFSTIRYGTAYHLFDSSKITSLDSSNDVLLVTAIANVKPLKKFLHDHVNTYDMLSYNDHHIFTADDLNEIQTRYQKLPVNKSLILTTEKDAVRLLKYKSELEFLPVYVLPVTHQFLFDGEIAFQNRVLTFLRTFQKKYS